MKGILLTFEIFAVSILLSSCGSSSTLPDNRAQIDSATQITPEQQAQIDISDAENKRKADEDAERLARQMQAEVFIENIERVFTEDQLVANTNSNRSTIAQEMSEISLDGTPNDFRVAYVDHIYAWEKIGKLDDLLKNLQSEKRMNDAAAEGVLATIFGSDASPFSDHLSTIKELKSRRPEFSEQVSITFQTLKRIAAQYGAKLPNEKLQTDYE